MCNADRIRTPNSQLFADMAHVQLPLRVDAGPPNLPPIETVRPAVKAPILRAIDPDEPSGAAGALGVERARAAAA